MSGRDIQSHSHPIVDHIKNTFGDDWDKVGDKAYNSMQFSRGRDTYGVPIKNSDIGKYNPYTGKYRDK